MNRSKQMSPDPSSVAWAFLQLLSFLSQGFSETTEGIPPRPRLWMQAFPCSGNGIAFLLELSAELRNQEDVAEGMFLDPFCCQKWVRLCPGLHVYDLEEEEGIMSKQPRVVCAGSGSVHIQPDRWGLSRVENRQPSLTISSNLGQSSCINMWTKV